MIAWDSHALSRPIEFAYSGRSVLNRTKAAVSPMHSGYFFIPQKPPRSMRNIY